MIHREDFVLSDTEMFYNIVRSTTSHAEAIDLLNRARHYLITFKDENGVLPKNIQTELSVLNDEIKYQNKQHEQVNWPSAVREICGPDLYELVMDRVVSQSKYANRNRDKILD